MERKIENIEITATSIEKFNKLYDLLKKLPDVIFEQVFSMRFNLMDVPILTLKKHYQDDLHLFLPHNTTNIIESENRFLIVCEDYILEYPFDGHSKRPQKYEFVIVKP